MKIYLTLLIIVIYNSSYAQIWIAGDTSNFVVNNLEQTFAPESKIIFDIDCDGIEDLNINSTSPIDINSPWERLSFRMTEGVQVYNGNSGFVSTFTTGQSVELSIDSLWTEHLDFIYGTGEAGQYGQEKIENKYISFRKVSNNQIAYCYILFSNLRTNFTIHKVISNCQSNPIKIITNPIENKESVCVKLYPNPSITTIYSSLPITEYKIYTMNGSLAAINNSITKEINIGQLQSGVYNILMMIESKLIHKIFIKPY